MALSPNECDAHHEFSDVADDGSIIQMIVWQVPEAVPPTVHGFKHRLVHVGRRAWSVSDNERALITVTSTVKSVPILFRLLTNLLKISSRKWRNGGRHEYT